MKKSKTTTRKQQNTAIQNTTFALIIGIFAMVLLIIGIMSEAGSLLQKILFLSGSSLLGITACINRQKMFIALQGVITIGAVLAFIPDLTLAAKYVIMGSAALVALIYLIKSHQYHEDPWSILGTIGLLMIALGYTTNPSEFPVFFNFLLGVGAFILTVDAAIDSFYYKIRIAMIWLILNLLFSIKPFLFLLNYYF